MEHYYRIRLGNIQREMEDLLSHFCFSHGALGLSEALTFAQPDLTYDPRILERRQHDLDVYFDQDPGSEFSNLIKTEFPTISLTTVKEETKDWLAEWKKGFNAFKLVGSAWVVPSWLELPPEAGDSAITIRIDPGMAFGTGTHATTKMAAYFIYKLSQDYSASIPNWTVLDVGTGTGILALLAEKFGFGLMTGIEIDAEARRKARENCQLNTSKSVEISELQLDEIREQYDVVVANIIDGVLLKLKKDLVRRVKENGHLFLTGILQERDNHFFDNMIESSKELKVIKRIQKDEWIGYWLCKQTPQADI